MSKLKDRIYLNLWLTFKPYDHQTTTDIYYLNICNEVKQSILKTTQASVLQSYSDKYETEILACFLTSYFEDLISGTNIWNSFIRIYKSLYGKQLPFYEMDDYYDEEINLPDICFLIWYFMNTIHQGEFIAPFNNFIIKTSKKVMDIFENAWEYAPENKLLKTYYTIDEAETDYYKARNLIDTVLFKTYLFHPDTLLDLRESEIDIIAESKNEENLLNLLNENRDYNLHNSFTRLLGLKGQEWVAQILGENHKLSKDFLNLSNKIRGYFFYKGQDETNIFIEHIASGKKFNLTKKSFDHPSTLKEVDTILYIGIANWKNEWWFSEIYFQSNFNADLVLDEKNSIKSRSAVNFLDHQTEDINHILEIQLKAFKELNDGQQIAFMESDKIESFLKDYMEFYDDYLTFSKKEKEEANQRARKDGFLGSKNDDELKVFSESSESGLVFFNPKSGVQIAMEVNSAFPMKNNPFYNENESEEHIISLFFEEEYSTELVMYCIDNFEKDLPFFKSVVGQLYLDNKDFLLRFFKRGNYFTRPTLTFTGTEN